MSNKMSVIVRCHADVSTNFGNSLGHFSYPRQIFLYKEVFFYIQTYLSPQVSAVFGFVKFS